jgi:adenosylmethionine-8-amino-7-oxononanoate aminotransferase
LPQNKNYALEVNMRGHYPSIVKAEGIYLYDDQGQRYLDGAGGSIVVNLGHGIKEFAEALKEQAEKVAFSYRMSFTTPQYQELAQKICELTNYEMDKVFLVSGGSEANEIGVKLARKFHIDNGSPSRYKVISRWQSYHGGTMGALSWTGFTGRRREYLPYLKDFNHIAPAYCYRCWFNKEPDTCDLECATALEYAINQEGPGTVSAFLVEPVVGAALCGVPPREGYFRKIREICDKYGVLLIFDEVMTGFGRTGKNFAYEHFDMVPDIICMGKGLSSGYFPLGGAMCQAYVTDTIAEKSGVFAAGFTYAGNPLGCAVGNTAMDYMKEHNLVERCARMGEYMEQRMNDLYKHPTVGDIRGLGLMRGVEFVKDQDSKESLDTSLSYAYQISGEARNQGLTMLTANGCDRGTAGDMILIGPPFIITEEQIDEMVDILDNVISTVEERNGFGG